MKTTIIDRITRGLLGGLFLLFILFLFNGSGLIGRSCDWEDYRGGMSWPVYRITLRPQGQAPAPDLIFSTQRYGINLTNHVRLKAQVLQSELPLAATSPLFYDTTRFARFSPDSVYYARVGMRGNYFSFALGAQPGFVVLSYRVVPAATAAVPAYPVQTNWRVQWQLYAWACLSLAVTFVMALFGFFSIMEERALVAKMATLIVVLLFAAAAGYVGWYDYTTGGEWPIVKSILALGLLWGYVAVVRRKEPDPEAVAPAEVQMGA